MHKPCSTTTSPSPLSSEPPASPPRSPTSTSSAKNADPPRLTFETLAELPFVRHAFTLRVITEVAPDVRRGRPTTGESESLPHVGRRESDGRILRYHGDLLRALGTTRASLVTARQVHGSRVAVVRARPRLPIPETDGLLTREAGLPLGVYVADCCAVYLVDRRTPAIGLLHSGKKGTQANIAGQAVASMRQSFQTRPRDVLAVLGPCIGPCHYEMDIPGGIERQLRDAGVRDVVNPRICTACDLSRFYSYRAEQGQTGRMLAVLMVVGTQG